MAKTTTVSNFRNTKKTSQDIRSPKMASMNKHKKRCFKSYRGQGRP